MSTRKNHTAANKQFIYHNPAAANVKLAGDFTDWAAHAVPMKSAGNGDWKASMPLQPGSHEYCFIVDGEWISDPNCPSQVGNPFGGYNSVCAVGATT